jgi:hypothetical protein
MSKLKSWVTQAARSLSHHLDRLRDTLTRLHGRLREAIAEAVSCNTASVVKDAVLAAMLAPKLVSAYPSSSYSTSYDRYRHRDGPYYDDDPYRPSWERDPYDDDPYDRDEVVEPTPDGAPTQPQTSTNRVGQALVMGCQAAVWWLRHKTTAGYGALTAIGVGAVAGVTAFYFGPFVAAAAALAGSTFGLTAIAEAARRAAAVLLGAGS